MRRKITQHLVDTLKPPETDRLFVWDASLPSFAIMITAGGSKSYVVQYRQGNKSRRMTIGDARHLRLDEARKEARAHLGSVAKGGDPLLERRKAAASAENSFESVARRYLHHESGRLRSVPIWTSMLDRLVFPRIGGRPIDELRRSEITALLDGIAEDVGAVQSDRVLSSLRAIFNWHARRTDDFKSPIVPGMARVRPKERARSRILSDEEIRKLWAATEAVAPFNVMIRTLLLTAARRTEISDMRRDEIDGDLWSLPAARSKTKEAVQRPLSSAALDVLATLPRFEGPYVFGRGGESGLGGFSRHKAALDQVAGITDWVVHDLRRTSRSLLSRAGVSADIAERCLGHTMVGVRGTYDRHRYIDEMRAAFEALAALIARIVNDSPGSNVVNLRA
jgi:integrase